MQDTQEPKRVRAIADGLRVSMFTSGETRCGIRDYTALLVDALRLLPDVATVRTVQAEQAQAGRGVWDTLRLYRTDARRYAAPGAQMNMEGASVAHVQHQYFFFGGVAPHKNHARAFLDAIRVPVVLTAHELAQPKPDANAWTRQAIALTNRSNFLHPRIRALIVHTDADREQLYALGAAPDRIHVVTHAIPPAQSMPDMGEAKRALGLEGRRVVLLFGFLSVKKGHMLALDALTRLPDDVTLLLAGDQHPQDHTEYVAGLRDHIKQNNLAARVRITGYLDPAQIPVAMAAADVAIAPFTQSSGSGSLANLLAYGRAIVASDIGPHQRMARDFPGCLDLFEAGDAQALAIRINAVLENAPHHAALQQAALAYAERHSYYHMARETTRIYQSLLG